MHKDDVLEAFSESIAVGHEGARLRGLCAPLLRQIHDHQLGLAGARQHHLVEPRAGVQIREVRLSARAVALERLRRSGIALMGPHHVAVLPEPILPAVTDHHVASALRNLVLAVHGAHAARRQRALRRTILVHYKEVIDLQRDRLRGSLPSRRQKVVPALDSPGPVVGVRLDHGVIRQDDLHVHVEEPPFAQSPRQELPSSFGLFLRHRLGQREDSDLALPPVPVLRQEPGQEDQEPAVMDHPPDIDGAPGPFDIRERHLPEAFHCQNSLVGRVGVAQNLHKILAAVLVLWPIHEDGVGNQAADAGELNDVVGSFGHAGSNHHLGKPLDALVGHDVLYDLPLLGCLHLGLCIALL
mmetsp:Transcript_133835/g.317223  ORF Transcript_133835/g.317223 Transcript_133835/m.317223 type:complete len:355 (-) Transcript_133835:1867-2931(-)